MNLNPYFRPLRRAQDQRKRKRHQIHWMELQNPKKVRMVKKHRRVWMELPNRKKHRIVKKVVVISACKFNIAPPMAIRIGNTLIWRMTGALMRRVHIQEQEYVMWW